MALGPRRAESATFEAEQPTTSTDSVVMPAPWEPIFPPHTLQVLLQETQGEARQDETTIQPRAAAARPVPDWHTAG